MNIFIKLLSWLLLITSSLGVEAHCKNNRAIIAIVTEKKGHFQIANSAVNKLIEAKIGQLIRFGDIITTSDSSQIDLKFRDDASLLRLNSNSHIVISGKTEKAHLIKNIKLKQGQFWYEVEKLRGKFQLTTPQATIKIDGTQLYAAVFPTGETRVWVIKGKARMKNEFGSAIIGPGQTGIATKEIKPQRKNHLTHDIPNFGRDARRELVIPFKNENGDAIKLIITFIKK